MNRFKAPPHGPPVYAPPNPCRKYELLFFFLAFGLLTWLFFSVAGYSLPEPIIGSPDVPGMPPPSDNFDCDDSALYMYEYFTSKGYECIIIAGNLDINNETFPESQHIWVKVQSPNDKGGIAYDWGRPCYDVQHYYGYELTYEQLKDIVALDIIARE